MAVFHQWNNLPSVVIYDVFQFLNKQDLINASATCKNWRACLYHPKIWPIKSMTIDLVNISAYEFRNQITNNNNSSNNSQTSNYRGYFKRSPYHCNYKLDPYRYQNNNNYNQFRSIGFNQQYQYFSTNNNNNNGFKYNHNNQIENTLIQSPSSSSSSSTSNSNQYHNIGSKNQQQHQLLIKNNSNFYAHNAHLKADYRQFLEKCSKFLKFVTIKFNAYDHRNLVQLIYTINILTHARSRDSSSTTTSSSSFSNDDNSHVFNNIESLVLKPIYIKTVDKVSKSRTNHFSNLKFHNRLNNKRNDNSNSELLLKVFDAIEKLISTNKAIRQLSLGCLEELLDHLPSLLNKLKNNVHVNQLVESLQLATIKVDPFYYPVHDVKFTWFTSFKNLIKLSIDYDYVSDDFIIQLATNCKKLKDLTLNIHGLDQFHPIINSQSWNHFKQNLNQPNELCEVELSINLLHTNESPDELKEIIQNVTIPIVAFRAYFAFSSSTTNNHTIDLDINNPLKEIINIISTQQQNNLRQLTLVDEMKQKDGCLTPNTTFSSIEENTLVMLAWRCRNLEELTLIGYEIFEIDLLAITRLRGENLKQLLIPDCCIYLMNSKMLEDEGYYDEDKVFLDYASNPIRNQVINEIAKPLNRTWIPLRSNDLSDANQYYLNTILN